MPDNIAEEKLQKEFNRWAEQGRGEEMESHHLPIVGPTLALMHLEPSDRILDVGCGTGWLVRKMAAQVTDGKVVGIDVSDKMIRRAEAASAGIKPVAYRLGVAERIPWVDNYFTKAISVESSYYWPDPAQGLREISRVLAPGGSAWILINYYRDNPYCHQWGPLYNTPAHLLAADEWAELFRSAGFADVTHRRIPDNSPTPDVYTGRWFRDVEELKKFKSQGALLVHGTKPARR
jgi:SAM-dependent methyltransferase